MTTERSRTLAFFWVAMLAMVAASGCMQPADQGPSPSPVHTPAAPCGTAPADAAGFCSNVTGGVRVSVFNIIGSACHRFGLPFQAPVAATSVQYPAGIRRQDSEGVTENAALRFVTCKQAEVAGQIRENFQFAYLLLAIQRPAGVDTSFNGLGWIPEAYTSDEWFHQNATANGIAVKLMPRVNVVESPVNANPRLTRFEFTLPGTAGPDYKVTGTRQAPNAAVNSKHALMSNATTFVALEFQGRQTLGSGSGSFEAGPSSYWGQHSRTTTQATYSAGADEDLTIRIYLVRI